MGTRAQAGGLLIGLIHKVKVTPWEPDYGYGDINAEEAIKHQDQARTLSCNAQPASMEALVRRFGIEIERGWKFFIRSKDARFVSHGDMVQYGGKIMKVEVPPESHNQGLGIDYAVFAASEVRP